MSNSKLVLVVLQVSLASAALILLEKLSGPVSEGANKLMIANRHRTRLDLKMFSRNSNRSLLWEEMRNRQKELVLVVLRVEKLGARISM